ncbi:MAG: TIR domain-containing protein [Rhodocyclaceae bacterium]|nr:TIR domain-containing protein [Rhodocyclaceae bacterium]
MDFDVFVSHASEDKSRVARPLVSQLTELGLRVWFDEFELTLGDSLRRSIDKGLSKSRYGIVILSPDFLKKEWPNKELDGLVAREDGKEKVILPIWHNVTVEDVARFSPILADKVAISTEHGIQAVAQHVMHAVNKKRDPPLASPPSFSESVDQSQQDPPLKKLGRLVTILAVVIAALWFSYYIYKTTVHPSFSVVLNKLPLDKLNKQLNESLESEFRENGNGPDYCNQVVGSKVCVGTKYQYSAFLGEVSVARDTDNSLRISVPITITGKGGFRGDGAKLLGLDAKNFRASAQAYSIVDFSLKKSSCVKPKITTDFRWIEGAKAEIAGGVWIDVANTAERELRAKLHEIDSSVESEIIRWLAQEYPRYVKDC